MSDEDIGLYHKIMRATKETDYDTFIKNYEKYMKELLVKRNKIKQDVKRLEGKADRRHKQAMVNLQKLHVNITNKLQQTYPIEWGANQMKQYVKRKDHRDTIEGFNALPKQWAMGDDANKKKSSKKGGRKKKTRKKSTKKMNLSASDYRKILKFYKLSIPKKVSNLRKKGDKIIAKKFCSCIKKVRAKFKKEGIAIAICTKSVITRKGIKRGKFKCKKRRSIKLFRGGSKRRTKKKRGGRKKKTRKMRGGVLVKDIIEECKHNNDYEDPITFEELGIDGVQVLKDVTPKKKNDTDYCFNFSTIYKDGGTEYKDNMKINPITKQSWSNDLVPETPLAERKRQLMVDNGMYKKFLGYYPSGVEGDNELWPQHEWAPCCSKCEKGWCDTLTCKKNPTTYCSPCKEKDSGEDYVINKKSSQLECTPPQ